MLFDGTHCIGTSRLARSGLVFAFVCMIMASLPIAAAEPDAESLYVSSQFAATDNPPIPLVLNATGKGFDFDTGGSEKRKLQFQLDQPLAIEPSGLPYSAGNPIGLDATLNIPLSPEVSLTGALKGEQESVQFQSLGSIQCTDGILRPDSYTASGCHFVSEAYSPFDRGTLRLGAGVATDNTTTAISWFTQESGYSAAPNARFDSLRYTPALGADLITPGNNNPLLPALAPHHPLSYFQGEATGVDLSFQLGLATDNHGDIRLGLALTRILEADFEGYYPGASPFGWTIADSFNTASLNLEWRKGAFSGGIQGFYRDQVDFLNRQSLDSLTTFDVQFTWRTPWNADLSVGASNVLNAGPEDTPPAENQSSDPFESIYGRIPYVRYKQDL